MVGLVQASLQAVALNLRAQVHRSLPAQLKLLMKHRSGSFVCCRAPNEPDPRLTSHYLRTVRRTVVRRLWVPSPLETSAVCVLNSVPRYFMGFRTLLTSAPGAGSFGTATSWFMGFPPLFVPFLLDVLSARRAITHSSLLTEGRYH